MNKIEDIIQKEGYFITTCTGSSMLPFFRDRQDSVVIRKKDNYKKYDIVLYRRNNQYILHRIVKVLEHGYIIRGDHCYYNENDIGYSDIIGYVDECYRDEKKVNMNSLFYKCYCILWVYSYCIRYIVHVIKNKVKVIMK